MSSAEFPRITISQASLPPLVSLTMTSEKFSDVVKKIGVEGIELLPFWGTSTEVLTYRRLRNPSDITSFHQTWQTDHAAERRAGVNTGIGNFAIATLAFPPRVVTDRVMQTLWKEYPTTPTVVHTIEKENTLGKTDVRFQLEFAHQNNITLAELEEWIKEDSAKRGIVYPTRNDQFDEWKRRYAPHSRLNWEQMAQYLIEKGFLHSVNLGPLSTEDITEGSDETRQKLIRLYEMGFSRDVVIEINPLKLQRLTGEHTLGTKTTDLLQKVTRRVKNIRDKYAR